MSKNKAAAKKQTNYADTSGGGGGQNDIKKNLQLAAQKMQNNKSNQNLEQAFKLLSEACNKDAENSQAFKMRGNCYNLMGDFQRALYDYSVAIRIAKESKEDPKILAEYYCMAGVQHYELGQLDEALKHYDLAIKNDN